jgi:hypothetical protein
MPTQLSITSLPGQRQVSSSTLSIAQSGELDGEVFEFGQASPLGGFQNTPSVGGASALGAAQDAYSFDSARVQSTDGYSHVPTGARLCPEVTITPRKRGSILQTRQLWEGTVTEVRAGGFAAVLMDKTNPANPDEHARFDFENVEIAADDRTLVRPGAAFYWIIGSEKTPGGTVKNISIVQFRRVPAWTRSALSEAAERAKSITALFQIQE